MKTVIILLIIGAALAAGALFLAQRIGGSDEVDVNATPIDRNAPDVALLHVKSPAEMAEQMGVPFGPALAPSADLNQVWERSIGTHVELLKHGPVVDQAVVRSSNPIQETTWFKSLNRNDNPAALLRKALQVQSIPGTSLIALRVNLQPPADAAAIVTEICREYEQLSRDEYRRSLELRNDLLQREHEQVVMELQNEVIPQLREREKSLGAYQTTGRTWFAVQKERSLDFLRVERQAATNERDQATAESKVVEESRANAELPAWLREYAAWTPQVIRLEAQLDELALERLRTSPTTRTAEAIDAHALAFSEREARLKDMLAKAIKFHADTARDVRAHELRLRIDAANIRIEKANELINSVGQDLGRTGSSMDNYGQLRDREQELRRVAHELSDKLRLMREYIHLNSSQVSIAKLPSDSK